MWSSYQTYILKIKGFAHETFPELEHGILKKFEEALKKKQINDDSLKERFKVFCFKHDLESLILASESQLAK